MNGQSLGGECALMERYAVCYAESTSVECTDASEKVLGWSWWPLKDDNGWSGVGLWGVRATAEKRAAREAVIAIIPAGEAAGGRQRGANNYEQRHDVLQASLSRPLHGMCLDWHEAP